MALLAWTGSSVSSDSSWLLEKSSSLRIAVSYGSRSLADAERHHDLFERRVAGPLADAVDRALDLAHAALNGREAVGDGQAEVVVAVRAEDGLVGIRHAAADLLEELADVFGRGKSDGVGQVDRRRARGDDRFDDAAEEVAIAARRIFGRKLHIVGELARAADRADRGVETGLARDAQLAFEVQVRGGEERVNASTLGRFERAGGFVDVLGTTAGQRRDHRPSDLARDLARRFGVGGRGDGEARFDDVHAERVERARHLQLRTARPSKTRAPARRRAGWCRR